jgi:signal transduction histidine kinase
MRAARALIDACRRHPWWGDGALALLLTLIVFAPTLTGAKTARDIPVYELLLLPATTVPLVARRYRPVQVFCVVFTAQVALLLLPAGHAVPPAFGAIVAMYTVASRCGRPRSVQLGARAGAAFALASLLYFGGDPQRAVPQLALLGIAWAVGDNLGTRRAYLAELEARAERLEREREEQAARATRDERARIARELHDVIAHNVSVMVVQASAGEELFDSNPQGAREALRAVATTGRDALAELRRLLGVIRPGPDGEEPPAYGPQPGLAALPELLQQVRDTGLAVSLSVDGEPSELPEAASLCAYRIVQEALTNTIKHAGATGAEVGLRYASDALEVSVRDDGHGGAGQVNGTGSGHGLIGMRERVALFGGEVEAGPAPAGGYQVIARLPLSLAGSARSEPQ